MLTSILSWSWIGTGLLLIVLVLLHSPKGHGWLGGKRQLHVQQRQQRRSNVEPSDMDMPGVVFVLGCDPECWLVELNQPTHKLNFQHAFFELSLIHI